MIQLGCRSRKVTNIQNSKSLEPALGKTKILVRNSNLATKANKCTALSYIFAKTFLTKVSFFEISNQMDCYSLR